jgi:hypothetical protein
MLLEQLTDEVAVELAPSRTTVRFIKRLDRHPTARPVTGGAGAYA